MNYLFGNIPFTEVIIYSVAGVVLLLVFNFLDRYLVPFLEKRSSTINPWWQKAKIISWLIYLGLFYSALLRSYTGMTLIFTVIVLGLGWEYWRNIFAGMLIKFTNQLRKGDFISTNIVRGTIRRISLPRTDIINEKGELVFVPNRRLRNSVVTHLRKTHDVNICVFNVKTRKDQTLDDLYQIAYNCPYIAVNQIVAVELKEDGVYQVKATIIDNSFIENANRYFSDKTRMDPVEPR
ncbi:MAG: mechanosensitive ion channel family protein [Acidobacteriota bacterium]|nr:mechanosensitive ion channel family protein [Acidobacteriota bacterium]MDH3530816.1 mechanosensitive ion channel family protein [Acidobacteriota bacterium]